MPDAYVFAMSQSYKVTGNVLESQCLHLSSCLAKGKEQICTILVPITILEPDLDF